MKDEALRYFVVIDLPCIGHVEGRRRTEHQTVIGFLPDEWDIAAWDGWHIASPKVVRDRHLVRTQGHRGRFSRLDSRESTSRERTDGGLVDDEKRRRDGMSYKVTLNHTEHIQMALRFLWQHGGQ